MASSLASTTSFGRAVAQEQPALWCRMRPAARCSLRCAGKGEGAGREIVRPAKVRDGSVVRDPKPTRMGCTRSLDPSIQHLSG